MKRLFIDRIDQSFDPAHDMALGPWCFIGKEDKYPDWPDLSFVDPFDDDKKLGNAEIQSRQLMARLIEEWAEKLNKRHGVTHSILFWRFTLIFWMLCSIQAVWLRFHHIKEFINQYGEQQFQVSLAPQTPPHRAEGLMEFLHIQRFSAHFDWWVSSLVMRRIAPKHWDLSEPEGGTWDCLGAAEKLPPIIGIEKVSRFGKLVRAIMGRLACDSVPGVGFVKVLFSAWLMVLPKKGFSNFHIEPGNKEIRNQVSSDMMAVLDAYLDATLPRAYGDKFKEIYKKIARERVYPGRLFISNVMPSDEYRRLLYARAVENGERLIPLQHGSAYGVIRRDSWAVEMEYPYHAFLTWGWKTHHNFAGHFVPLPAPMLSTKIRKHSERTPRLAMVATKMTLRDLRLYGLRPNDWVRYREMKKIFISTLNESPRANLSYYAYRRGIGDLTDDQYLRQQFPDLRVVESGLNEDMLSSRLTVIDHLGTSINVGLAANVPMVCYWDPLVWPISDNAAGIINEMRRVGILHDDAASAARHINMIWDDVAGWWQSTTVQAARLAFVEQFAQTSPTWWWAWLKALTKLQTTSYKTGMPVQP